MDRRPAEEIATDRPVANVTQPSQVTIGGPERMQTLKSSPANYNGRGLYACPLDSSRLFGPLARRTPLGVSDTLVSEEGDVAIDRPGAYEPHGFLVAGRAEEALAGSEHDRVDLQPQLVDEIVLHQCMYELKAGPDDDFPV